MFRPIMKGEKKHSRVLTEEDDGNIFTITNPVFDVVDAADAVVQAESSATVRNNGTAAVELFGLVDTTDAGFLDGSSYKARYTYTVDDELKKVSDQLKIVETWLGPALRIAKDAKEYATILIEETDGAVLTITSPVFDVVNDVDVEVQASSPAFIRNNGTAQVELYGLVDTTDALFVDGSSYKARFTSTIDDQLLKGVKLIKLLETRL